MAELNASNLRKERGNEGPDLVGLTELTSPYYMVPPSGSTSESPQTPEPGTLRFNTDSGSLEYFKGAVLGWETIQGVNRNLNGGTRGLIALRYQPSTSNENNYLTISTGGNVQDFGDLEGLKANGGAAASSTRGVYGGGLTPTVINTVEYIQIMTTGNSVDFGDASTLSQRTATSNAHGGL